MSKTKNKVLNCSKGNTQVIAIVFILIAFVVGMTIGALAFSGKKNIPNQPANQQVSQKNNVMQKVTALSGKVDKVDGQEITFTDQNSKTRVAVVDSKTKITIVTQKTANQITADQQTSQPQLKTLNDQLKTLSTKIATCKNSQTVECQKALTDRIEVMQKRSDAQQLTSMYTMTAGALADVKVGMTISASSQLADNGTREDLSSVEKFTAGNIQVKEVTVATPTVKK
jgi:small-conductance mechanosensitive channel